MDSRKIADKLTSLPSTATVQNPDQESGEKKFRSLFIKNGQPTIAELLIKHSITAPPTGDPRKFVLDITDAIQHHPASDIIKILVKYGYNQITIDQATRIKQDFYYEKLDPVARAILKDLVGYEHSINALPKPALRAQATLHGYRDATAYLIDRINKEIQNRDPEKAKINLEKLLLSLNIPKEKAEIALNLMIYNAKNSLQT